MTSVHNYSRISGNPLKAHVTPHTKVTNSYFEDNQSDLYAGVIIIIKKIFLLITLHIFNNFIINPNQYFLNLLILILYNDKN